MVKRVVGIAFLIGIVGGALAGSKSTDPDTLARIGEVVGQKAKSALPDNRAVAGPLAAFKIEDSLPAAEKAQVRIRSDKRMEGTNVSVLPGANPGEIRLRGTVRDVEQAQRAVKLAEGTIGVDKVLNELAIPE